MTSSRLRPTHEMVTGTDRGSITRWMSEFPQEIPTQIAVNINDLGKDGGFDDIYLFFQIYPIPEGAKQGDRIVAEEYIQAGGTAERLTVEVRRVEEDGQPRQYTVGHVASLAEKGPETLVFGENQIVVSSSEVLTAAEAIELFQHYYEHHDIPEGWRLREIGTDVLATRDEDTMVDASIVTSANISDSRQAPTGAIAGRISESGPEKIAEVEEHDDQQRRVDGV